MAADRDGQGIGYGSKILDWDRRTVVWIGGGVFERGCAGADGRSVRALAAGCGLPVV